VSRALEQLANTIKWQQQLGVKAEAELSRLDQRQAETQQEMTRLEQERQAAEVTARQLAEEAQTLSSETLLTELSQARTTVASIQGRQRSQQAILSNQQVGYQQLLRQIESKQVRAETLPNESFAQATEELHTHDQFSQLASTGGLMTEQQLANWLQQTRLEQTETSRQRLQRWGGACPSPGQPATR
jgi:hypothetical protein